MTEEFPLHTDTFGARVLSSVIANAIVDNQGVPSSQVKGYGNPVIVAGPKDLPCADNSRPQERRLQDFDGAKFTASDSTQKIRRITNGKQIAWPTGRLGMCVRDDAFWAVNIGSLVAPSITATSSGSGDAMIKTISRGTSTIGKAAVLEVQSDGKLKSTRERLEFIRWDDGTEIADGTLIQLAYVSGSLTLIFANCSATPGLTGLAASPAPITVEVTEP
jgi:hypothetical protein